MLACDAKNRHVFYDIAMRNTCDSDSRCGLACDASARDATSLAMQVERCEPLSSGGWKTYRKFGGKPLPKNVFGPPTYDTFCPPLFWRLSVISLKRERHRPDQPQFLRPLKVVLESTLCSTFSPPPPRIHAIRFAPPPPQPLPKK